MSLKNQIETLSAIHTAGFKLVGSKSINTDDGACWTATLAFGTQKLVRVSNGGYGGPDETEYLANPKLPIDTIENRLATFFTLPAVQALVKEGMIKSEGYALEFKSITQEEFEAKKAKILAANVAVTDEAIESAVQFLADTCETVAKLKRSLKNHVCYVKEGGDAKGEWYACKTADTPANRQFIQMRDTVDYFIADLLAGL